MFFFLSKTIGLLTKPFSWLVILMILAVFLRKPKWKRICLITSLLVLLVFSNPWFLNFSLSKWEPKPIDIDQLDGIYDIGIVLGGFARYLPEYQKTQLNDAGDRIWQAIYLYKKGKIKKILISGGGIKDTKSEAEATRESLILFGIPDSVILFETASRNTFENLNNSAEIIRSVQPDARCLVITSAIHIPRAMGCAKKVGLPVDAFPAEHLTRHDKRIWAEWITPRPEILKDWDRLINEWVGILAYKIRGYL
ncbi:MAG: YdcF family protein [Bacteroidales bacterium]|jgi:uncharacterized SAM-binding protein YcdF (DUF218 family)|nr:YdcF family protein [Bacteroidales bacterium]